MNSIQFIPPAMTFEAVMVTTINLTVSTVPQRRSKYRKDGGMHIREMISYHYHWLGDYPKYSLVADLY